MGLSLDTRTQSLVRSRWGNGPDRADELQTALMKPISLPEGVAHAVSGTLFGSNFRIRTRFLPEAIGWFFQSYLAAESILNHTFYKNSLSDLGYFSNAIIHPRFLVI